MAQKSLAFTVDEENVNRALKYLSHKSSLELERSRVALLGDLGRTLKETLDATELFKSIHGAPAPDAGVNPAAAMRKMTQRLCVTLAAIDRSMYFDGGMGEHPGLFSARREMVLHVNASTFNPAAGQDRSMATAVMLLCLQARRLLTTSLEPPIFYLAARTLYCMVNTLLPRVIAFLDVTHGGSQERMWKYGALSSILNDEFPTQSPRTWLDDILTTLIDRVNVVKAGFYAWPRAGDYIIPDIQTFGAIPRRVTSRVTSRVGGDVNGNIPVTWKVDDTAVPLLAIALSQYVHLATVPSPIIDWLNTVTPGCVGSRSFDIMRRWARASHRTLLVSEFSWSPSDGTVTNLSVDMSVISSSTVPDPDRHVRVYSWIRGMWSHFVYNDVLHPGVTVLYKPRFISKDRLECVCTVADSIFLKFANVEGQHTVIESRRPTYVIRNLSSVIAFEGCVLYVPGANPDDVTYAPLPIFFSSFMQNEPESVHVVLKTAFKRIATIDAAAPREGLPMYVPVGVKKKNVHVGVLASANVGFYSAQAAVLFRRLWRLLGNVHKDVTLAIFSAFPGAQTAADVARVRAFQYAVDRTVWEPPIERDEIRMTTRMVATGEIWDRLLESEPEGKRPVYMINKKDGNLDEYSPARLVNLFDPTL